MAESFLARQDLDECAEVHEPLDCSLIDLAYFGLLDDGLDHLESCLCAGCVLSVDRHGSVVIDVDFGSGCLGNSLDCLSACSDDCTDLVLIDLGGEDLRSVLVDLCSGTCKCAFHDAQDVVAAFLGLLKGLAHDLGSDSGDLDIHLESCDSVACSGNLEVHVAEVVLFTEDIGKNLIAAVICAFGDQTHCDTCNRL